MVWPINDTSGKAFDKEPSSYRKHTRCYGRFLHLSTLCGFYCTLECNDILSKTCCIGRIRMFLCVRIKCRDCPVQTSACLLELVRLHFDLATLRMNHNLIPFLMLLQEFIRFLDPALGNEVVDLTDEHDTFRAVILQTIVFQERAHCFVYLVLGLLERCRC